MIHTLGGSERDGISVLYSSASISYPHLYLLMKQFQHLSPAETILYFVLQYVLACWT